MSDIRTHVAARRNQPERLILVCIVGTNQALADSCRAKLDDLCPGGYNLQKCESSDVPGGCDIYIWDFESSPSLPAVMLSSGKGTKVVIVKKSSLAFVRRKLLGIEFAHVLSPASSRSLRTVLESAIARQQLPRPEEKAAPRVKRLQTNPRHREQGTAGYRISISDNGRAIDPDHREKIFDERSPFGDAMDRSGSGLGLAIRRMTVETHHGRIWAESGTQGSSLAFVLPLARSFSDFYLSEIAV